MNLYAHECCECGGAMSYSLEPDVLPDAMCKDCAVTFIEVARFMGVATHDQHGLPIDSDAIYIRSRAVSEDWMANGRGRMLKWCKLRGLKWMQAESINRLPDS